MNDEYLIMNNTKKNPSSYENGFSLAGMAGFEPANAAVKVLCLTA